MSIFIEVSLIIVIATALAALMRFLKQPLIMGYMLTGLIIGPLLLGFDASTETVQVFSEFGVAILLFIVGLHLSPKEAGEVGKVSVLAGLGQVVITCAVGFLLTLALGFEVVPAIFIATALTFSSTIIVLKLLTDKHDLEKLYAKITIGILLIQDFAAVIALVFVTTLSKESNAATELGLLFGVGIALTVLLAFISYKILPKLSDFFASSQEMLFLFALGWGFGLASLFELIGFSIEIGALIAGITLSISPYSQEISTRLKPLRDFFIIMFFVFLGAGMNLSAVTGLIVPIVVLSAFVLIGNPIIVILIINALGYRKRTSFLTGLAVAQISEFSLILILIGVSVGKVGDEVMALTTMVALITIAVSTYMINYSDRLYPYFAPLLAKIERKKTIEESDILGAYDLVLFGCNRVGWDFVKLFRKLGQSFLVVDFDPDVIKNLTKNGINNRYGDAEDADFLEDLNLGDAKMVISTIPDFETNKFLVEHIGKLANKTSVILISYNIDEALSLYEKGAEYIIMPHFIGGSFAAEIAYKNWDKPEEMAKIRENNVAYLKERKALGHAHPLKN